MVRASTASALEAIGWRMAEGAGGDAAAAADLAGLTGLYRALQANEYAVQDGSYDLAKVLGGSSFLVPLSSHEGDSAGGVGFAVWGGGDFRGIGGGTEDAVKWDGSVWSARVGADVRFVDSLLTGMVIFLCERGVGLHGRDRRATTVREPMGRGWRACIPTSAGRRPTSGCGPAAASAGAG